MKTLLHNWVIKFGPSVYLVTDRGSKYVNKEMAHLCTIMGIRHSPRTSYSPWRNGLVEVPNRNLGTHLRMFHMILLKIGLSKSTCMLMPIIHNHFLLNSMFLLLKLSSKHNPEFPLPLIKTLTVLLLKHVFPNIVLNFQNIFIMTKQIYTFSFIELCQNPSHYGF